MRTELALMTVRELREEASRLAVPARNDLNKRELIEALIIPMMEERILLAERRLDELERIVHDY